MPAAITTTNTTKNSFFISLTTSCFVTAVTTTSTARLLLPCCPEPDSAGPGSAIRNSQTLLRLLRRGIRRGRGRCVLCRADFRCRPLWSLLLQLRLALLDLRPRLVVGEVAEHLHPSGVLLRGEDAIVLVDIEPGQRPELSREQSVPAHPHQKLSVCRVALQNVLHRVGDPYMTVRINRDSFRPRERSWTISRLAPLADKISVRIENLDAVVVHVRHVQVSVLIDGHIRGYRELARLGQAVLLACRPDFANQVQLVGVIHQHLVEPGISYIQEPVLVINRHAARINQAT